MSAENTVVSKGPRKDASKKQSSSGVANHGRSESAEEPKIHKEEGVLAPLRIPLRRRLQTGSVLLWLAMLPMAVTISVLSSATTVSAIVALPYLGDRVPFAPLLNLLFTLWAMVLGAYFAHVFVLDRRWRKDGARKSWFADNAILRKFAQHYRNYFPASIVFDHDDSTLGDDDLFVEKYFINGADAYDKGTKHRRYSSRTTASGAREPHPHRSLLFCCHPHGLFSFGVWCTFVAPCGKFYEKVTLRQQTIYEDPEFEEQTNGSTDSQDLDMGSPVVPKANREDSARNPSATPAKSEVVKVFDVRTHTMSMNFYFPIWREFLMFLGFMDVDRGMFIRRLSRKKGDAYADVPPPIRCSALVPGGAEESVDCCREVLTLKRRQGFIKVAMETGATLVPVYTFGETKLYRPLLNPGVTARFLHKLQKLTSVGTPLVRGRGIFNYSIGFLPHRQHLVTVIGRPIEVKQMARGTYTEADVNRVHAQYIDALQDLYKRYVGQYGAPGAPPSLTLR